jgi:hypothetical protein
MALVSVWGSDDVLSRLCETRTVMFVSSSLGAGLGGLNGNRRLWNHREEATPGRVLIQGVENKVGASPTALLDDYTHCTTTHLFALPTALPISTPVAMSIGLHVSMPIAILPLLRQADT